MSRLRTSGDQIAAEVEGMSWGQFKPMLADALVEMLNPVREEHSTQFLKLPSLFNVGGHF